MFAKLQFVLLFSLKGLSVFAYGVETIAVISEADAYALVQSQEEAREAAKDEKEAQLRGAAILGTAVADMGSRQVVLNRVILPPAKKALRSPAKPIQADFDEAALIGAQAKQQLTFTLSGTVRDGISELWWQVGENHFKIFVNANFLYLTGIADFENEDTVYSVFSIIMEDHADVSARADEWRPTAVDFSSGQLEYFIIKSSGDPQLDEAAFEPIDLMLIRYGQDFDQLKIAYENGQKIRAARVAYLEANPPQQRDTIINFAPIDKAARRATRE